MRRHLQGFDTTEVVWVRVGDLFEYDLEARILRPPLAPDKRRKKKKFATLGGWLPLFTAFKAMVALQQREVKDGRHQPGCMCIACQSGRFAARALMRIPCGMEANEREASEGEYMCDETDICPSCQARVAVIVDQSA